MKHLTLNSIHFFIALLVFFLLGAPGLNAQPYNTWIEFSNASGCATTSTTTCSVAMNQVDFYVTPQAAEPPKEGSSVLPRFKAFWITGDGNFIWFADTPDDSESRNPSPYNYYRDGSYNVSVYLTGKYTDKNPPPGALRQVNAGPVPKVGATDVVVPGYEPTDFNEIPGLPEFSLFPIHAFRRDYLTPIVVSYPASLETSWVYLFYNGKSNRGGAWTQQPLVFQKKNGIIPNYFSGSFDKINSHSTNDLDFGFDGALYIDEFKNLGNFYNDFVYFPMEGTNIESLPPRFSKKRYFPEFWANKDERITIGAQDSAVAFFLVVTGTQPAQQSVQSSISQFFEQHFDIALNAGLPINSIDDQRIEGAKFQSTLKQQSDPNQLQYIQGVYASDFSYVAAHDPNQLTIKNIESIGNGKFRVTFHLEMCNKGAANTNNQEVVLYDKFGNFSDFQAGGNDFNQLGGNKYIDTFNLSIPGIPKGEYEMMCDGFDFIALSDCKGIRSLWKGNREEAFEVCVRFLESDYTECSDNFPIDRCQYKIDGQCPCVEPIPNGDCCMLFCFLVAIIALIVLFWMVRLRS